MKKSTTDRAKQALWERFAEIANHEIDENGYVQKPEQNLVEGLDLDTFRSDFEGGSGHELDGKFKAVHSSSALAANTFAPFKQKANASQLMLNGVRGLNAPVFEQQLRTGLGGTPPNLDVFVQNDNRDWH